MRDAPARAAIDFANPRRAKTHPNRTLGDHTSVKIIFFGDFLRLRMLRRECQAGFEQDMEKPAVFGA
ncbi:hypothetical protein GGD81_000486 [Rhodobium orientis]|uniref:hypothetical protein n=1 Tax=Rhodobium orientis TaxID=34017 RepID=UPI0011B93B46|nr:hypothetical protein [Rhodobium orientis]MBB4301469.1 hypothetical protein [Rhodobium orientis]